MSQMIKLPLFLLGDFSQSNRSHGWELLIETHLPTHLVHLVLATVRDMILDLDKSDLFGQFLWSFI